MSIRSSRVVVAARRLAMRVVPAGRRDWVEAVWAEAPELPQGWRRLAWRAGGVWLVVRVASRRRGLGGATLFLTTAGAMVWSAWRGSSAGSATSVYRVDVVVVVMVLAGLSLMARWPFGPALDNRAWRFLRIGTYAALLALIPAKYVVEQVLDAPPRSDVELRLYRLVGGVGFGSNWTSEIAFLVVVALCATAVLWVTSRRSRIAPVTLAAGTGMGLALGLVLYAVGPLGLSNAATDPWLPGADIDPLVVLAWILLVGGPVVAGILAERRFTASSNTSPSGNTKARQIVAAGLLTNLVGALFYTVAATSTTALMIRSDWLRRVLYRQHQLFGVNGLRLLLHGDPGALTYSHEITAAVDAPAFLLICIPFALIALVLSGIIALGVRANTPDERDDPRRGGRGPHGQEPPPFVPDGEKADECVGSAAAY